jgi:phosphonate degradation associated HDIG domain protein
MALTTKDIVRLLSDHGAKQYGREAVSQLEHALQCAHLAELGGEPDELVIASLLHDVGHMLMAESGTAMEINTDRDDLHQYTLMPFLRGKLPDTVLEPIRLHVDAKRYLCQSDTAYFGALSPASVHSLALQGGVFSADQAHAFLQQPHAEAAARLRRYDDLAKVAGRAVPPLEHYLPRLEQLMTADSPE